MRAAHEDAVFGVSSLPRIVVPSCAFEVQCCAAARDDRSCEKSKKYYLCYFGKINVIDIAHNYEFLSDEMSCDVAGDATHLRG